MRAINDSGDNGEKLYKLKYLGALSAAVLAVGALLYVLVRYALPIFIPFIAAGAVGAVVSPVAARLSRKTRLPHALWGVLLTLVLLTLLTLLTVLSLDRLMTELLNLLDSLEGESGESFLDGALEYISGLSSRLPVLRDIRGAIGDAGFWDDVDIMLKDSVTDFLAGLAEKIPAMLGNIASGLPEFFITVIVTVVATFYFSSGKGFPEELLNESSRASLSSALGRVKPLAVGWLRAYLLIFLITFAELFLGLSLLGVKYAFLFSALIAAVDILPILGTGTVLIPWGVLSLLMKNYKLGIGLLILYGIITVVREAAEPRIIGKVFGISPALSLISTYVGLKLFGFWGMIIAPAAAMLAVAALGNRKALDKKQKIR